jgi:hypothetical protein
VLGCWSCTAEAVEGAPDGVTGREGVPVDVVGPVPGAVEVGFGGVDGGVARTWVGVALGVRPGLLGVFTGALG